MLSRSQVGGSGRNYRRWLQHGLKITGPLIRIVGDKFPGNVKKAIVDTLQALLIRGGGIVRIQQS